AADRYFAKAESAYRSCQATGSAVRGAVALRDELFARLPGYSRWLALRRPPADIAGKRAAEDELQRAEALWAAAHHLSDLLDSWPFPAVDDVAQAAANARREFADLVSRYTAFANGLGRDPQEADAPTFWEDLEAARAAAHPDLELRLKLW